MHLIELKLQIYDTNGAVRETEFFFKTSSISKVKLTRKSMNEHFITEKLRVVTRSSDCDMHFCNVDSIATSLFYIFNHINRQRHHEQMHLFSLFIEKKISNSLHVRIAVLPLTE